jgi:hypothetical protein
MVHTDTGPISGVLVCQEVNPNVRTLGMRFRFKHRSDIQRRVGRAMRHRHNVRMPVMVRTRCHLYFSKLLRGVNVYLVDYDWIAHAMRLLAMKYARGFGRFL